MRIAAILTAAGSGTRLGSPEPKALVRLGPDALVRHAALRLRDGGVRELVVTCPPDRVADVARLVDDVGARCVVGGATRQASVAVGLSMLPDDVDAILVHDAARALAPPSLVRRLIAALDAGAQAVVPGLPVVDTVKRVAGDVVTDTLDRRDLVVVQTPQAFRAELLRRVHDAGQQLALDEQTAVSDDAGLVERFSEVDVQVVAGEDQAMKITTRTDLALAEAMLGCGVWT